MVSPKLAIISVGKNNRYGHPHKDTVEILKRQGIKVLRTDFNGEVEIITDGTNAKYSSLLYDRKRFL